MPVPLGAVRFGNVLFSVPRGSAMRPLPVALSRARRFRPRLEVLEGRCTPTVTASFNATTGALTLTGDAGDNHVTVTEGATNGSYAVAATDGLVGAPSFAGVKSIALDLKGQGTAAGDTVDLVGDAGPNTFLSGALSVTGAGGLKVGFQSNFNVSGAVSISKTTNTGGLTVQTGPTSGAPASQGNVTLGATTVTNTGTGNTTVNLQGTNASDVLVSGALSVTMGSGTNTLILTRVAIAGGLTETGANAGAAADSVSLSNTTVGGFVSLNATAANSRVVADLSGVTIGVFFSVASGNGNDTVTVNGTSVLGLGLQPQQQTFGVDLKAGANTSNIGNFGPNAANVVHGSLFHFGAGLETFNLKNYTITSFVTVNAQAGNIGLNAISINCKISSFLSCVAAAANDNVTVSNLSIGQNFALDLGSGINSATITDSTYLGSYSEIDAGTDTVTFTGNTGFGDVTLSANRLIISAGKFQNNQIAGNASFTSTGNGTSDTVNLGTALGIAPSATNGLTVGKALTVNVGAGSDDQVNLDNVIVKGDLNVTETSTVNESVTITNTSVGGNLAVNAGGSTATVFVILGTLPTANTGALAVVGNVTVTTGAGNDTVTLTDVTIGGSTTVTTNAGLDSVDLEEQLLGGGVNLGGNPGPSNFVGAVTIATGDASDTINVGTTAVDPARFFAAVTFDGGAGTDTLNEVAPQYLGGPPTKTSIP
jgi:large repetitive protein